MSTKPDWFDLARRILHAQGDVEGAYIIEEMMEQKMLGPCVVEVEKDMSNYSPSSVPDTLREWVES